jgi:hypothetical protein
MRGALSVSPFQAECPDRLHGHTQLDAPDLDEEAAAARWPEALIFTESYLRTDLP